MQHWGRRGAKNYHHNTAPDDINAIESIHSTHDSTPLLSSSINGTHLHRSNGKRYHTDNYPYDTTYEEEHKFLERNVNNHHDLKNNKGTSKCFVNYQNDNDDLSSLDNNNNNYNGNLDPNLSQVTAQSPYKKTIWR